MSELYNRQQTLKLNTDISVIIVGCGGVGFNFGLQLAMSGVKKIYLFDNDVIEESNLNRLPVPWSVIGKNKASILKQMIDQIRPNLNVLAFPYKFKEVMLPHSKVDWLVDCTDKIKTQEELQSIALNHSIKYVKLGYDGERIGIHNRVGTWTAGEEVDGYTITPSWVVPASIVASMAVAKLLKYNDKELVANINTFFRS